MRAWRDRHSAPQRITSLMVVFDSTGVLWCFCFTVFSLSVSLSRGRFTPSACHRSEKNIVKFFSLFNERYCSASKCGCSVQVELPIGPVRPDISFRWNNEVMVAIELQRSSLPTADVARRTSIYDEKGIAVLWVLLPRNRFWAGVRCSTKVWERFLHELYNDKIFCWHVGQELFSTHLDPYILRTEYRERYNRHLGIWCTKEISHFSKRSRIPRWDDIVPITDLKVIEVLAQQRGQFSLLKARLWSR